MKAGENSHSYMKDKKNNQRNKIEDKENSLRNRGAKRIENENKYGSQKFASLITVGENDRIAGNHPQDTGDEKMQVSYTYGYVEKGSRVLEGKFASGIFTEEIQRNFGIVDFIHNIPEKYIKNLKTYPAYLEGRVYQMGKAAYDYCLEHNISFEEYSQTMEILYPEIKMSAFKAGYETREIEVVNKKSK